MKSSPNLNNRKIIHLDMDAFFASVEIRDNPKLKGLPVVVGGSPKSRSVVCAASYEARKYGIHSAMPCSMAYRLCPDALFVPLRFDRYREVSGQIHRIFQTYTDIIEPVSLDEAWLDVTNNRRGVPSATWLARQLKEDIFRETGLTASAGVSYNKFLAKIASDEDKPNGLYVIPPKEASAFLEKIRVRKLPGVGKVTEERLKSLGIEWGYQLLSRSEENLVKHFGKFGRYLYRIIRGEDHRPIVSHYERKSIGIENTFGQDFVYGDELREELRKLLLGLFKRLQKQERQGKTLTLKVKFFDFHQITRSITQDIWLTEEVMAHLAFEKLMEVCLHDFPDKSIRLLGVSVSNLNREGEEESENLQLDFYPLLNQSGSQVASSM